LLSGVLVEVAGGFVGEQQAGALEQCPGDGDSLLLAAGQPGRQGVLPTAQADLPQQFPGKGLLLAARSAGQGGCEDVVQGGQRWKTNPTRRR